MFLIDAFYRWMDVSNVVNHKKCLSLECVSPSESAQFHFANVDGAKRAFRTAVLQNTFFRKYGISQGGGYQEAQATLPIFHQVMSQEVLLVLIIIINYQNSVNTCSFL